MNPNASEWKPSVSAPEWRPSGFSVATPSIAQNSQVSVTPPAASLEADPVQTTLEEEIDESDPLWQAVLKITCGDRAKALNMISDPDSLFQYPEVASLLNTSNTPQTVDNIEVVAKEVSDIDIRDTPLVIQKSEAQSAAQIEIEDEILPENLTEGDPREHLNLVFIGHVDAGKSTLSGNILYITENVDKRTIERYEKEAKERNRDSWFLAFIMDTNEEERAKGKTVEVGRAHFETSVKRYTIMDAPGHKNYVPNMIMGASQADIGILVISARKGEFEAGFDRGGQSREHAMLAKTLGVAYLIVVINKMDEPTVKWSKQRFDECVTKLRPFLRSCGFTIKTEVKFMPISGLGGANIKDEVDPKVCSWWKTCYTTGENNTYHPTLFSLLDSIEIKGRDSKAPLRIPILDRYIDRGTIGMGKVESGVIRIGQRVTVMPTRQNFKIDGVWANEVPVAAARPGENVLVKFSGAGVEDIRKGFVICTEPPCRAVTKIIAQIALMDMPESTRIMTAGFQAMFHAHTAEEECTISKIFETTNKKGVTVKDARFAGVGMKVVCMLEVARAVPVDTYTDFPFLGRFTLRTDGKTIAIGKITKLPPKKD
jgi:peptide chain release factor subunit 3